MSLRAGVLACLLVASCYDEGGGCDCNPKHFGAGWGVDLTFLPFVDGNVFQCVIRQPNLEVLGECQDETGACTFEWCYPGTPQELVDDMVKLDFGWDIVCDDTPRHLGPCRMVTEGRGCNAYNGCFWPVD